MAFLHILGIILKVLGFTVLGVLGLALLILLFLLLIPIGADFEYIGGEYKLSAKACGILIQLLPKKALDLTKEEIFELIKKVLGSLKKFGQLTVDRFLLHYTAAGKDPADTAKTLAYVNASLCALEPICSRQFRVKDYDVWTDCDFTTDRMKLDLALCITLRLWQFGRVGVSAGFGALGILLRHKRRKRKEKKLAARNEAAGIKTEE